MSDQSTASASERIIIFLIGAVQFFNVLDFMVVMPLGPDFARDLQIPISRLGLVAGSYTFSAAISGVLGALVLDRFDRRKALAWALFGLSVGTLMGGLAVGPYSLYLSRVVAGFFGGPATALSLSIVADAVSEERRGRALGAVMGAVSVAQVLGVPASLRLSSVAGWRWSFLALAGVGLLLNIGALVFLPKRASAKPASMGNQSPVGALVGILKRPETQLSYMMTAVVMAAGFVLLPNLSPYIQFNMGLSRSHLDTLYMLGGVSTFLSLRLFGRLVDRFGSAKVTGFSAPLFCAIIYIWFCASGVGLSLWVLFVIFLIALSGRNVAHSTLASKVPGSAERARFMSMQSSVQHAASSAGAALSSVILVEAEGRRLLHMDRVAWVSMGLTTTLPVIMFFLERMLGKARQK